MMFTSKFKNQNHKKVKNQALLKKHSKLLKMLMTSKRLILMKIVQMII